MNERLWEADGQQCSSDGAQVGLSSDSADTPLGGMLLAERVLGVVGGCA